MRRTTTKQKNQHPNIHARQGNTLVVLIAQQPNPSKEDLEKKYRYGAHPRVHITRCLMKHYTLVVLIAQQPNPSKEDLEKKYRYGAHTRVHITRCLMKHYTLVALIAQQRNPSFGDTTFGGAPPRRLSV